MKILIVSDSHGRNNHLENVINKVSPIDLLIHLGDLGGSEDYIEAIAPCKVEMIAGNNDFFSDLDYEKIIKVGNYKIFLTHGHRYDVYCGIDRLKEKAIQHGASIVMFGHTHCPLIDVSSSIWAINPGSISYPRQVGGKPSYVIMDIDSKGIAHFALNQIK